MTTPGIDWKDSDVDEGSEEELPDVMVKQYRATAARLNYMSFDRPARQYAIK